MKKSTELPYYLSPNPLKYKKDLDSIVSKSFFQYGARDENRTRIASLGSWSSTTELRVLVGLIIA